MSQPPAGGYPPPDPSQPGSYPPPAQPGPPAGGYPPPAGSYPPPPADPAGYQPPQPGYQPPQPGYAPPPPGYQDPAAGGYPPPAGGYPPPAGGYPPPAAGYQGGAPAFPPAGRGGTPSLDVSNVGRSDWIVIGSGLVLLIFSFFGWLSSSFSGYGISVSESVGAWHRFWWLATVLGVAVAVVVAMRTMMGQALPQIKPQFLMFAAAGGFLITLISLIDIFTSTSGLDGDGGSVGPGFGIWVCLIVSAAQTYFVWLWAQRQPGWTLPKLPGPAL